MSSSNYGFWHMLSDILFNGNRVSGGGGNYESTDEPDDMGGPTPTESSRSSFEFNPSDESADAFRSVFGDDNE